MILKLCLLVVNIIGYVYVNWVIMFYFNYINIMLMLYYSLVFKVLLGISLILF